MAEEDLIFGKNRHFFGGIEPSNMLEFTASYDATGTVSRAKVVAKLPADTVIDGQTLCSVAGAVIRRSTSTYPKDEFDGVLVKNITNDETFFDEDVEIDQTYYYAAFPYTTQGVYNRNAANRASCTPVAIIPGNMQKFTAESVHVSGQPQVKLTATLPASVTGCTIAGAVIRRSTTGYPVNESDGSQVANITSSGTYYDTNVEAGIIYYYAAFPYSTDGVYNTNNVSANQASCEVSSYEYLFGYDLVKSTSNPSGRVTYPSDVDNANFTPAKMNFGGSFNYGSWNFEPGEMFMPRPCMLTYAGVVDHYLNPNDYTKKIDGTASSVANTSFGGNAMMEWPKIYTKRWEENGVYHFRCSDISQDDTWDCWCNYDRNDNEIDHFYTPIYFGSNVSSKLRSISGQANMVSKNAMTEINYAKANGNDWYTEVLADRLLIQDLLVMMGKSTDGQTVYGKGRCDTNSAVNTGTMNSRGMFWGSNNGTDGVKVFGMEHFWGNLWRRTAGWMNVNGTQKVKLTRGTKDGSTASDYNTDGNGYKTVSGATPSGTSGGYISSMKTEAYGRIPVTASGSSSTYEADGLYYSNSGTMYAVVGGSWYHDLRCGPFYAHLGDAASYSSSACGAALSCKPLADA
jgi:hypothetical protein